MFCENCGEKLEDSALFCQNCGHPVNPAPAPNAEKPMNEMPAPNAEKPMNEMPAPPAEQPVNPSPAPPAEQPVNPPTAPAAEQPVNPPTANIQMTDSKAAPQEKKDHSVLIIICCTVAALIIAAVVVTIILVKHNKDTQTFQSGTVAATTDTPEPAASETPPVVTPEPTVLPTEEPATPEPLPSSTPEPAQYLYAASPSEAFDNYMSVFTNAVNTGDFSEGYMAMQEGSPIYRQQEGVAEYFYGQGITEEVLSYSIKSTEVVSTTKVNLVSDENIKIEYGDGTTKVLHQSYRYTCEQTEDGWLFTNMEEVKEKAKNPTSGIDSNKDYVLPSSSTRYYSKKEIKKLNANQLYLARNEIYARHGYKFKTPKLKKYFKSKSWYIPLTKNVPDSALNKYEKKNLKKIIARENKLKKK